jgi:hypothetical protein
VFFALGSLSKHAAEVDKDGPIKKKVMLVFFVGGVSFMEVS